MNEIKVSVIMPVYNAAAYLKQTLDSVCAQTLREIEVICVDDGSTDDSLEILEAYAQADPRIRVLHQQNQYAGVARNNGLAEAAGKYVIFWDADDLYDETALEKLYAKAEAVQADICVCDAWRMDEASGLCYRTSTYIEEEMLPEKDPFSCSDMPAYIFTFTNNAPWNKLFRRSFVLEKKLRFQPLRQANDLYFVILSLFYAERITVLMEPLVTYRMDNSASLTGKASANRSCAGEALEAALADLARSEEFTPEVRVSFGNKAWNVMLASLRTQWEFDAYAELFYHYRDYLLPKCGVTGADGAYRDGYIFNPVKEEYLRNLLANDAQQFLMLDFRNFERKKRITSGKLTNQKQIVKDQKQRIGELKQELKSAKKEAAALASRLAEVESSTSYKLGRTLTSPVRFLKDSQKADRSKKDTKGETK